MRAKNFRARHQRLTTILCVATWLLAFTATHLPGEDIPSMHVTDKTLHTFGYGGLATLLWLTLWTFGQPASHRILLCLTILPMYGVFDETTQPFFNRACDVHDWMFDCVGVVSLVALWELAAAIIRPHVPHTPEHHHHHAVKA